MSEHVDDNPDDDDRGQPLRDRMVDTIRRARRSSTRDDEDLDE